MSQPPSGFIAATLLLFATPCPAQISLLGARSAALGGATTALHDDVWGRANPAAWAWIEGASLAVHGAQLYGMHELRLGAAQAVVPLWSLAIAFGVSSFGFDLYRETTVDAGLARQFGAGSHRNVAIGLRSRWKSARIDRYGRAAALGFTGGIHLPVTPFITLGAVVHNAAVPGGALKRDLSRRIDLGVSFRPSDAFTLAAGAGKDVSSPISVAAGVELGIVSTLTLRAGVTSNPPRVGGGAGLQLPHLGVDVAANLHEALGWSPSVSIQLLW